MGEGRLARGGGKRLERETKRGSPVLRKNFNFGRTTILALFRVFRERRYKKIWEVGKTMYIHVKVVAYPSINEALQKKSSVPNFRANIFYSSSVLLRT